ncbi:hypothetical protein BGL52_09295 [Lacticaseibacillus casei]|uniref:Uncharacterized protein n=1 Tax=Lacticaseibacillus casei TaxID=1582 RepID=A0AAN1EZC7_LACCA|nr:hypothetical protein BGL52_09295 [Lacticaseibacillus casei]
MFIKWSLQCPDLRLFFLKWQLHKLSQGIRPLYPLNVPRFAPRDTKLAKCGIKFHWISFQTLQDQVYHKRVGLGVNFNYDVLFRYSFVIAYDATMHLHAKLAKELLSLNTTQIELQAVQRHPEIGFEADQRYQTLRVLGAKHYGVKVWRLQKTKVQRISYR